MMTEAEKFTNSLEPPGSQRCLVRTSPEGDKWRVIEWKNGQVFVQRWSSYSATWDSVGERHWPDWAHDFKTWKNGLSALKRRCPNND